MGTAYLSASLHYKPFFLYSLVYRDIKPENIGFDVRGDLKLFDFGLCKSLSPSLADKNGMFKLTGQTGSQPYIAPEVAMNKPYNETVDVYSFGMLLYEILSLKLPFEGYSRKEFYDEVFVKENRPVPSKSWHPFTSQVMTECWSSDPTRRPLFERVATIIRGDLNNLTSDEAVHRRTAHMMNRSMRSFHGM